MGETDVGSSRYTSLTSESSLHSPARAGSCDRGVFLSDMDPLASAEARERKRTSGLPKLCITPPLYTGHGRGDGRRGILVKDESSVAWNLCIDEHVEHHDWVQ